MSAYQGRTPSNPYNKTALSSIVRKLWVDYVSWTTALIYTILFGTQDKDAVQARVEQTAQEFSDLFKQFYGEEAAAKLRVLFMRIIEETTGLIEAHKEGDLALIADKRQSLYAIADEVARQMSLANPYWDRAVFQISLYEIINQIEDQVVHIMAQQYDESVEAYDDLLEQAYRISDNTAYGLIRQFNL